jgi:hypothetical protein
MCNSFTYASSLSSAKNVSRMNEILIAQKIIAKVARWGPSLHLRDGHPLLLRGGHPWLPRSEVATRDGRHP